MEPGNPKQTLLIEVDHSDHPIGFIEKQEAHLKGVLHRAFSIFVFRRAGSSFEVLLQQRALHKYHSGGLWTNTCCSHTVPSVPIEETAQIRLQEEMGFSCPLTYLGSFYYKANVGEGMIEHEIDHVFASLYDPADVRINREEAHAYKWISVEELQKLLAARPSEFTAWLPGAFQLGLKFLDAK